MSATRTGNTLNQANGVGAASVAAAGASSAGFDREGVDPEGVDREIFDREDLLARVMGDEALVSELVQMFQENVVALMQAVQEASFGQDPVAVSRAAHALHGAAATISAVRVAAVAAALEEEAIASNRDDYAARLRRLSEAVDEFQRRCA